MTRQNYTVSQKHPRHFRL